MPTPRILIIIPTYNEAENITALLTRVLDGPTMPDVLVIDDGSPDGTADQVRVLQRTYPKRLHLLERPRKMGLGTAYLAGFAYALARDYTLICEMDADFSHDPDDLPRLIEAVQNGADLAIGSRYVEGGGVRHWPRTRLMLSYGAGVYTRLITRMPIRDVTAGFKCFHRRVLETLDLDRVKSNGYSFQVEMHYRTWKHGFHIVEVPIIFTERTEGQSKMSNAIVREAMFKVWELRVRALLGKL